MTTTPAESLSLLRRANLERQAEWCPDQTPDLSFRGNELAGEIGEACNVIKKLERERLGWRGSRDTVAHLAEELADGIICIDLIALQCGIDLWPAVVAKFNAASEANNLATRLSGEPPAHIEKADTELIELQRDKARLDFLDRCNAALNARFGTSYGWELILNHNVTRLMLGRLTVDLNDAAGGNSKLPSCRAAIDARIKHLAEGRTDG